MVLLGVVVGWWGVATVGEGIPHRCLVGTSSEKVNESTKARGGGEINK